MDEKITENSPTTPNYFAALFLTEGFQTVWTSLIIVCGLLALVSAFVCLCRRNSGFGDDFTDDEWAEALAERMQRMMERNTKNQRMRSLSGNEVRGLDGFEQNRCLIEMEKVPKLTPCGDTV
ncbi:unnamed protein product [Orchesella dallaii]|uniref:Uncharacterized protein n=1 Tax=Orchesella dallaii TaxID=48710 RepID=A0ABP1QE40_9HEXA